MSQQPIKCEHCGYVLVDPFFPVHMRGYYEDTCPSGECLQFCCARCHGVWSTHGPANCPSCSGLTRWVRFCIWLENKIKRKR